MRNLKKVLALVMVLGLMVTSSSALKFGQAVEEGRIDTGYHITEERDYIFID